MTDLEQAEQAARELIPLPEMAGSEQLRRSIVRALLLARADEAAECEYFSSAGCRIRAGNLQEMAEKIR